MLTEANADGGGAHEVRVAVGDEVSLLGEGGGGAEVQRVRGFIGLHDDTAHMMAPLMTHLLEKRATALVIVARLCLLRLHATMVAFVNTRTSQHPVTTTSPIVGASRG